MTYFGKFFLDREKDIIVTLDMEDGVLHYTLRTPNHGTGNLISNLARVCELPLSEEPDGLRVIRGTVPGYIDALNRKVYILRFGGTKVAEIRPDGTIERRSSIPAISKTLMSQTKDYRLELSRTLVKTYIPEACKFRTDLHTHMSGNLPPEVLIALGIRHRLRYPLYYIRKLELRVSPAQRAALSQRRRAAAESCPDPALTGKYRDRWIDDHTYIDFSDLILGNPDDAAHNLARIRNSLAVMKDGQAVFADLEKVYLYRYVFTKGAAFEEAGAGRADAKSAVSGETGERGAVAFAGGSVGSNGMAAGEAQAAADREIFDTHRREEAAFRAMEEAAACLPDEDVAAALRQMLEDRKDERFAAFTLFQNKLLWIARNYRNSGVDYAEISDTSLVKPAQAPRVLALLHAALPSIREETGVTLRFLASLRRIPLSVGPDRSEKLPHLKENLQTLRAVASDPYVAGSDIVGEEINDIRDLAPVIREIVRIAAREEHFTIRIHAGENDSLPDNVFNAVTCVREALAPGEKMPPMRIGHGLYTADLSSHKGRLLIRALREGGVTLEFQITSNVRLNNLSDLSRHPIRRYLKEGIRCVQGTDGGALYGTNSIDEELSLEKMLDLTPDELLRMRSAEEDVRREALEAFSVKMRSFETGLTAFLSGGAAAAAAEAGAAGGVLRGHDFRAVEAYYQDRIAHSDPGTLTLPEEPDRVDAAAALEAQIAPLPAGKVPVLITGGSFNNDRHRTRLRPGACALIDELLERGDPEQMFFVLGYQMLAYEKYLTERSRGRYEVFAIVPSLITRAQERRLRASGVKVRISIEPLGMGLYKSFYYEIFKRRRSVLVAFDGNSSGLNIIQDAKNSRRKCRIFIYAHSKSLRAKAQSLRGYVTLFGDSSADGNTIGGGTGSSNGGTAGSSSGSSSSGGGAAGRSDSVAQILAAVRESAGS